MRSKLIGLLICGTVLVVGTSTRQAYGGCFDAIMELLNIKPQAYADRLMGDTSLSITPIYGLRGLHKTVQVAGICQDVSFGFDNEVYPSYLLAFWKRVDQAGFENFMNWTMGNDITISYGNDGSIKISNISPTSYIRLQGGYDQSSMDIGTQSDLAFSELFLSASNGSLYSNDPNFLSIPSGFSDGISRIINQYYYNNIKVIGVGYDTGSGIPELIYNPSKLGGPFEKDPALYWSHRGSMYLRMQSFEFKLQPSDGFNPHDHMAFPHDMKATQVSSLAQIAEAVMVLDHVLIISGKLASGKAAQDISNLPANFFLTSTQFANPFSTLNRGLIKLELNRQTGGFTGQHDLEIRLSNDSSKAKAFGLLASIVQNQKYLSQLGSVPLVNAPTERLDIKGGNVQGMLRFYISAAQAANNQALVKTLTDIKTGVDAYYTNFALNSAGAIWSQSIFDKAIGQAFMTALSQAVQNNPAFFSTISTYLLNK